MSDKTIDPIDTTDNQADSRAAKSPHQPVGDSSELAVRPSRTFSLRVLWQVLLAVVLIAGAVMGSCRMMASKPATRRHPPPRRATLVEVAQVKKSTVPVVIEASGIVKPAREVAMHPRVQGEVVQVSDQLVPGGLLSKGQVALRIDPSNYRLAQRQAQATLARARADLRIEQGRQDIARAERNLLGGDLARADEALVLRQPQLESVEASVASAQASLERARLDLTRTTIRIPFDAVVRTRSVEVGSRVTEATVLATLAGTDTWWIETTIPVDQVRWIQVARHSGQPVRAALSAVGSSSVRVFHDAAWGAEKFRTGQVIQLTADVEEQGRLARLLVAVDDPLVLDAENAGQPRLFLGAWVRLEIEAAQLDSVVALDRELVRDGDRVWLMTPEGRLDIRPITIAFRNRQTVLVSAGLDSGELLVTTAISSPVQGMQLRTQASAESSAGTAGKTPTDGPPKRARQRAMRGGAMPGGMARRPGSAPGAQQAPGPAGQDGRMGSYSPAREAKR
ncbi:MAG: efflux RND transporter periplasmic adaptor subunit [Proteobacteria bacterium]|nr:efflux RND transporter periplasmic adaptor subunit [Pseudomonadota bacterium]